MTTLIVGSTAAHGLGVDLGRGAKDLDVFSDKDGWLADVFWHDSFHNGWLGPDEVRLATLDELYTIKISHSYWELPNGSWTKHMEDSVKLRDAGARLIPELHQMLYRVWAEKHGAKRVDLNMDKTEFFTDGVKRRYDHDSIHYSVAYGDRPMYESVLKAPPSVAIDMPRVWALPVEDQIRLFREEVYATALERKMVPADYRCSPRAAYAWALRRTITSLTKGRSATFMALNYDEFRAPDIDYVAHHLSKKHLLEEI